MLAAAVNQVAELEEIQDEYEATKKSMTEDNFKFVAIIKETGNFELVKHHGAYKEKLDEIHMKVCEAKEKLQSMNLISHLRSISEETKKVLREIGEESATAEM